MNSLMFFARRTAFALILAVLAPVFGSLPFVGSTAAEAAVISKVTVQGNQRVDAETVKAYIVIKPGKSFGAGDIDESIKILYGTGLFSDVTISQRGSTLVVIVVENPIVNSVTFEGNKKIKSNVLVNIVDLKTRGVLTDAKLQSDVQRIKDYYQTQNRANASVEARVTDLPNNRVDVVYVVREGERTGVAQITFVGNQAYSSSRLKSVITTRTTNWLSWLNKRDRYDEAKLEADQDALRRFYMKNGYADFQVLSADVQFDAERGKYYITFTLEEGPRYRFGAINIDSSIPGVDTAALTRVVTTRTGRTFDALKVERTIEDLTIELSRAGFVFAQVRPRGDRNYTDNTIDITYVVDEGPRVYIERIDIRGNTKTRDYVIRREFDVSEGDPYNRVLIDKAERRLRNLDYFKQVVITTEQGSAPDRVIVVVYVEDQSTGSFSVAAGVSTSQGIIAEVALEETNFLGRGQTVRIAVGGGQDEQTYNISFTDPYFLGNRMAFGFDAYRNVSNASSKRPFGTEVNGGGLRLGLPITEDFEAQVNYKISQQTITDTGNSGYPFAAPYFPEGSRLTSSAGYALTYSTLDSRQDPREGVYVRFAQDFAGIGGDARYIRTTGDARYYHPLWPDSELIGMVHIQGGNIFGLGQNVAIQDNFFKGSETVRGFAPLGFGPRDNTPGCPSPCVAIGGKNYAAATAEVQFPLPLLPPDFGLRGAVFADAGVLFGVDNPGGGVTYFDDTALRSSVGGSILWASPFGLLRADFAQVLTKQSYDQTQVFRIGAGTTF